MPYEGLLRMPSNTADIKLAIAAAVGVGIAAAIANALVARDTERNNPPTGKFIEVDGVRLHYVERGEGEPLVLLHGNGVTIQDFETSGLVDLAAANYRVIAFDRPGFGHSTRPRTTIWTPAAQADLIHKALNKLGVSRFIVLGHSWGAAVAIRLALDHPEAVRGLVLASGYYYPGIRADVVALSAPAIPGIGDVCRYTISPLLGWLLWPVMLRKLFGPATVPAKFEAFPRGMALRPSQLRAAAAETMLMIPGAYSASGQYDRLTMPVVIIAGDGDRLIDIGEQSERLHRDVAGSRFRRIRGAGHMVHQTATDHVMSAINDVEHDIANGGSPTRSVNPASI